MVLPNLNGPLARFRLGRLLHRLQLRRDGTPPNFLLTSFTSSARVRVAGMKLRPPLEAGKRGRGRVRSKSDAEAAGGLGGSDGGSTGGGRLRMRR